jgi:septal ring factor EnvC (AmiA/AmiB activator)
MKMKKERQRKLLNDLHLITEEIRNNRKRLFQVQLELDTINLEIEASRRLEAKFHDTEEGRAQALEYLDSVGEKPGGNFLARANELWESATLRSVCDSMRQGLQS